jgi:hypothetical protein
MNKKLYYVMSSYPKLPSKNCPIFAVTSNRDALTELTRSQYPDLCAVSEYDSLQDAQEIVDELNLSSTHREVVYTEKS